MLYTILGITIPLVALALFTGWGLLIGIKRVRVRFACVLISFLVALTMAFVVKNLQAIELMSVLEPYMIESGDETLIFLATAERLYNAIAVCGGALLAPWVFLLVFILVNIVASIFCGISFFIASLFRRRDRDEDDFGEDENEDEDEDDFFTFLSSIFGFLKKNQNDEDDFEDEDKKSSKKKMIFPRVFFYALLQVMLTVFVILTPVVATLNYLPGMVAEADEIGVFQKIGEKKGSTLNADLLLSEIDNIKDTPLVVAYRYMGGDALCNAFSNLVVEGRASDLETELTAISEFGFDIFQLYQLKIEDYTADEIVLLREIDKDMQTSVFLPVVSGEFIYGVTDAWLDESGPRKFMGMTKPSFDKNTTTMAADPFEHILVAFHNDAHDIDALRADFRSVERIMEILVNEGVVQSMNYASTNALVDKLTAGTTMDQLLAEIDKNPSFQPLRQDIIIIGMRSVGSSLKINGNTEVIFDQFNDDMANKLNEFTSDPNLTAEEKKEKMTNTIRESYQEKAGKELDLSDNVVGLYADALLEEFDGRDDVTPEEMSHFFEVYSGIEREPE